MKSHIHHSKRDSYRELLFSQTANFVVAWFLEKKNVVFSVPNHPTGLANQQIRGKKKPGWERPGFLM